MSQSPSHPTSSPQDPYSYGHASESGSSAWSPMPGADAAPSASDAPANPYGAPTHDAGHDPYAGTSTHDPSAGTSTYDPTAGNPGGAAEAGLGAPTPPPMSPLALTGMILGIVSLATCQLYLGIPGLIVSILGQRATRDGSQSGSGMALAGTITSAISIVLMLAIIAVYVVVFGLAIFGSSQGY